jgi:leader peptidase (prepilin peptidase) / N-methyltransferase
VTELPLGVEVAAAAIIGAVVGSFLNVCIFRMPLGRSVVWPGSVCAKCSRPLAWYENVPVFSFLILRTRCRTCGAPISWQYPIVEAVTTTMFAFLYWSLGPTLLFLSRAAFGSALITLFAIDLEHHLLPNAITLPGIIVGFVFSVFTDPGWRASLIGILAGGGVLWGIAEAYFRIRHEEGLGMGDVKMLGMIGAFLGWKLMLLTMVLASVAGSVIGVALIVSKRGDMKYALPFGTFLALGAGAAMTVGPAILNWYIGQW